MIREKLPAIWQISLAVALVLTIGLVTATPVAAIEYARIDPTEAGYDLINPDDVATTITWNIDEAVESIHDGDAYLLPDTHYTVTDDDNITATLTILDDYLGDKLTEPGHEVELTIDFDICGTATFTITVYPVYNIDSAKGYPTIQDAIDDADADNTIVLVEAGPFPENVSIHVEGLTLKSYVGAVIDADGGVGIEITADGVTVQGVNIEDAGDYGIYVNQEEDGFEVYLLENVISGADYGIYIRDEEERYGGSATVEGNTITDIEDHAIFFHAHGDYTVEHVTVTGNTISDSDKGIKVHACDESTIELVTVEGNTIGDEKYAGGHAIRVQAGDESRIDAVVVHNNTVDNDENTGSGHGIRVHSGYYSYAIGSVEITDNEVYYPGCHGIRVQLHGDSVEDGITITGNTVLGNEDTSTGIRADASGTIREEGITLQNVIVENNTVTNIGENGDGIGIRVQAGGWDVATHIENVSVTGNTVTDAGREGIRVHAGRRGGGSSIGTATVEDNTVTANPLGGVIGIRVSAGQEASVDTATLKGNYVEGYEVGIWHRACFDGSIGSIVIEDNEIVRNEKGVLLDVGAWECTNPYGSIENVTIRGNDISENDYGVYVYEDDGNITNVLVEHNNIEGNNEYGVINEAVGEADATLNWWGDASGPFHCPDNPGTGDRVSDNVDFMPWLMEEDGAETTETNTDSGEDAEASTTNVSADATGGATDTTVSVGEYVGEPSGVDPGFAAGAFFFDVHVGGTLPGTLMVEVNCPGGDCSGIVLRWFDGTEWHDVEPAAVDENGVFRFTLDDESSPTIAELTGTPFGLGNPMPTLPPVGGAAYPVNTLTLLLPWLGLVAIVAGTTMLLLRRRQTQN